MNPNTLALLPEYILTLAGVLVMLLEPILKPGASRKPLGWFAILAVFASGVASWYQLHLLTYGRATILAFSGTIQVDAFSVFFHFLIAAIAIVTLLSSLDYFDSPHGHAGEYFALVLFGATGMMLMTAASELLVVFVGLEISSISTYILAGFRKGKAVGAESSIKYFLLGSFATAFFLYGIAMAFGATGSTSIPAIAQALSVPNETPRLAFLALGMILIGLGFKVSAAPFHVWTPRRLPGCARSRRRLHVHRPQGRRLRRAPSHLLSRVWKHGSPLGHPHLGHRRPFHDRRQPRRAPPA